MKKMYLLLICFIFFQTIALRAKSDSREWICSAPNVAAEVSPFSCDQFSLTMAVSYTFFPNSFFYKLTRTSDNTVLYTFGPGGYPSNGFYQRNTTVYFTFCLEEGTYLLEKTDNAGDGYKARVVLTYNGSTLFDNASDGIVNYESFEFSMAPTCNDGIQNGDEIGIDCGGACGVCSEPVFNNPPSNVTLSYAEALAHSFSNLSYSNNEEGDCAISGTVVPVVVDDYNSCGGTRTATWSFTDRCGRPISHSQTITVNPAPQASWISPPA
ncbi:MAG: hypothetical protein NWQ41_01070, partial [Saprospiraceae bacterium]|nr:hypothetical protein [Saprospiraceae bacterium]